MKLTQRLIALGAIAITLNSAAAFAQSASDDFRISVPPTPIEIQVPAGNQVFMTGKAIGTQNYICIASGVTFTWQFIGPQATLFVIPGNSRGTVKQLATHFLSLNPFETGIARATWQSSDDTSSVWAAAIASSSDSRFVAPGAIPWLLLQVKGGQLGPVGGSQFVETTFIQRLNTAGGLRPTTGCSDSTNVGSTAFVPYTADYYFYRAGR